MRGKKHQGNQVRPYLYFGFVLPLTPEGYMVAVLKEYTSNTTETKHLVDTASQKDAQKMRDTNEEAEESSAKKRQRKQERES